MQHKLCSACQSTKDAQDECHLHLAMNMESGRGDGCEQASQHSELYCLVRNVIALAQELNRPCLQGPSVVSSATAEL